MSRVYDPNAFAARVDLAASYIAAGRSTTRTFDTCFEMNDGDAVAVAVYRRARRNPKLRANLWRYLERSGVVAAAFANRRRPTRALPAWSAELRRAADKAWAATQAAWAAQDAANPATANPGT